MSAARAHVRWGPAMAEGVGAGLVGVAAMTLAAKAEQRLTGRPDSYVPARTTQGM